MTACLTLARYLFEKGKEEECRMVLAKLHGGKEEQGYWVLSEAGEREYEAMRAGQSCRTSDLTALTSAITWDKEHGQDKWSALWKTKAARYRSFVACSSQSWWGEPLSSPGSRSVTDASMERRLHLHLLLHPGLHQCRHHRHPHAVRYCRDPECVVVRRRYFRRVPARLLGQTNELSHRYGTGMSMSPYTGRHHPRHF